MHMNLLREIACSPKRYLCPCHHLNFLKLQTCLQSQSDTDVTNLVVNLPIRRGAGVLTNVWVWEHTRFFIWQILLFQHHYHYYPHMYVCIVYYSTKNFKPFNFFIMLNIILFIPSDKLCAVYEHFCMFQT